MKEQARYIAVALILGIVLLNSYGCTIRTRVVIVPPSTPVILAETIEDVSVMVLDEKTGELLNAKKTIYKGQHVLSYELEK